MHVPVTAYYDSDADVVVFKVPAADGEGDVELLRMDVAALSSTDLDRLRHVRNPERPMPEPGQATVTRRNA